MASRSPGNAATRLVVDRLWSVADKTAHGYETVLPSGRAQIIFSLSGLPLATGDPDCRLRGADARQVLQGPSSRPRRISRKPQIALCGASFRPGGAGAVFGRIDDTADRILPLSRFWGADAPAIGERLRALGSHGARLDLLEDEIGRRIADTSEIKLLSRGMKLLTAGAPIIRVCEELGCSPYVLRKLFLRNVGFTPKRYLRIERFRSALHRLTPAASLPDVALDARFSDQSHMTREMEQFASMTPGRLRAGIRPHPGHVPEVPA